MFTLFSSLPIELRLMIWRHALPEPRIVHLKQRRLRGSDGIWWERVRSDIAMWPCDEPFEQDELAPWEKDDWDAKFEAEYEGDDIFNSCEEVERLDRESQKEEYYGFEVLDDFGVVVELDRDSQELEAIEKFYAIEDGWDTESLQESEFGDGVDKPKQLWGFSTESPISTLLLTCRDARNVALQFYQSAFSSLGGLPQVYFDPHRDTLFIDHETFVGQYEDLPSLIEKYIHPSDLARVTALAVEGLGAYEQMQYGATSSGVDSGYPHESWLLATSLTFPNIEKVTEISSHLTYGPQTQPGQKYLDLKVLDSCQDGKDIYGQPENTGYAAYGTFYVNCLRIDRSLMDWDRILDKHFECYCDELELDELWHEWRANNPSSKPTMIEFDWADLIPAADEKLLLHDALMFEMENNEGEWLSYDPKMRSPRARQQPRFLECQARFFARMQTNPDGDPNN